MNPTVGGPFFDAFNVGDVDGMLACLFDDVVNYVNEGRIRRGKEKFAAFRAHMNRCYREKLTDFMIFEYKGGVRVAAEFLVTQVGTFERY